MRKAFAKISATIFYLSFSVSAAAQQFYGLTLYYTGAATPAYSVE